MPSLPSLIEVEAERSKRSLSYFVRKAWHLVEPGNPYLHNWHIDIISDYLTAVTAGEIRNLIINIPPRHMKSLLVCVMWPTWVWTFAPEKRWLFGSYSGDLAVRDAVKSRRIIQSAWYQERFGDVYRLAGDQNAKSRYENDRAGHRISVGVAGTGTGEGGDILVVDDPHKAEEADSDAMRQAALDWYDHTMSTRGNNPQTVARVVIMQRLHEDDLTGHLLEAMKQPGAEHYEHLCLPARYEPSRFFSSIGLQDPRSQPGELLWPARFDETSMRALEVSLGTAASGQLQQRPSPAGGAIFQVDWWRDKNRYPYSDHRLKNQAIARWLSFDTALKDDEKNDYTARGVVELLSDYRLIVRHSWKQRLQLPQLASAIQEEAVRWNFDGKLRGVVVEDKGSGTSALQSLRQEAPQAVSRLLVGFIPGGSKEYRARQASLWCSRDCILLPWPDERADWLFDFEDTLYKFPAVKHDDEVDWFSQIVLYLENYIAEGWKARAKNE